MDSKYYYTWSQLSCQGVVTSLELYFVGGVETRDKSSNYTVVTFETLRLTKTRTLEDESISLWRGTPIVMKFGKLNLHQVSAVLSSFRGDGLGSNRMHVLICYSIKHDSKQCFLPKVNWTNFYVKSIHFEISLQKTWRMQTLCKLVPSSWKLAGIFVLLTTASMNRFFKGCSFRYFGTICSVLWESFDSEFFGWVENWKASVASWRT